MGGLVVGKHFNVRLGGRGVVEDYKVSYIFLLESYSMLK